ncbi:MFS transporter, partial [Bacteroidota bacterium]
MSTIIKTIKQFPGTFWSANSMELFERLAWYGIFTPLALYLTGSTDTGALGFSQAEKGALVATVVSILYFLPVITGAIADKFGYKKVLIIAYIIMASGYFLMGQVTSYAAIFAVFMWIAIGAGLFKPVISATIGKTTNNKTSSIGFGIFYQVVNIGGFVGPYIASSLRALDWSYAFLMSSAWIIVNIFIVIFIFKEPERKKNTESLGKSILTVLRNIWTSVSDIKLAVFLIIIIGFWTVYNQLFYSLPVFIEQWVDINGLYNSFASFSQGLANAVDTQNNATVAPEMLINMGAMFIVIFQIFVSALVMKMKPLRAMMTGIFIVTIGATLFFLTQNGWFLILAIFIFALGEMASSPKITEYMARIAPKDKVALYIGCSFLPLAGGHLFGGLISGSVYERLSDKLYLLQQEIASRGLSIQEISDSFTQNDYFKRAEELLGMDQSTLTSFLWENYNPSRMWYVMLGIGMISVTGLF